MEDYSSTIRIREVIQQKGTKAITLGDMIDIPQIVQSYNPKNTDYPKNENRNT